MPKRRVMRGTSATYEFRSRQDHKREQERAAAAVGEAQRNLQVIMTKDKYAFLPRLRLARLKDGDVGQLGGLLDCVQVIGEEDMLVTSIYGHVRPILFWVTGKSTAGFVDGGRIDLSGAYWVRGTQTYTTVEGGSRTVFVLEHIDSVP